MINAVLNTSGESFISELGHARPAFGALTA